MGEDFEIIDPHEAQIDTLLQILAVLIRRLGGETVISRAEFEEFEGVPVTGCLIAKGYVRFRLGEEAGALATEADPQEP
jgi:hypothetical protein